MKFAAPASLLFLCAATAAAAQPQTSSMHTRPVCIRPFDTSTGSLDHTHVVDSRTVLFYMRDGKVWKNTLTGPCPGLLFHGFTFVANHEEVCSNAQSIHVIATGEVCSLGTFTPYTPPQSP